MSEAVSTRNIELVTAEIIGLREQAQRMLLGYAIEIGRRLVEAKGMLNHGEWGKWLRERISYSQSTAENLMRIFNEYGADQLWLFAPDAKSQTLGNLPYTKALKLLAIPEEEREAFVEEHRVGEISTRELDRLIKEKRAAEQEAEAARQDAEGAALRIAELEEQKEAAGQRLQEAQTALEELRAALKEAEQRPIEVAVQEADPEEIAAMVEAELEKERKLRNAALDDLQNRLKVAEGKKTAVEAELKKASDELKKLKDKQKALKEQAEKARAEGKAEAEAELSEAKRAAEGAAETIKTLEKQLQMADQVTAEFRGIFETVSQNVAKLGQLMGRAAPEQQEKLRNALMAPGNQMIAAAGGKGA